MVLPIIIKHQLILKVIWASSDFGDRTFHDGTGKLGNMIGGSDEPREKSAPIIATLTKEIG